MTEGKSFIRKLREIYSGPATQASLFHYIKEEPPTSIWSDMDWSFLRHPIRTFKEEWRAPSVQSSLFHADDEGQGGLPFTWRDLIKDLFTSFRAPLFIPSVFSDPYELLLERAQIRTRRAEAGMLSFLVHVAIVGLLLLAIRVQPEPQPQEDNVVMVTNPVYLPFEGDGRDGGGGGGGGKGEKAPPATGRMPDTARYQLVAPDPTDPQPLVPAQDLLAATPTVVMPIDIPQDISLPIGDVAPPNQSRSSGPGTGGGIGTGYGTGVGSGRGPGVGPGEGGGMGGGSGGGIGSGIGPYVAGTAGLKNPVLVFEYKPPYTEEARKARAEGIVTLSAVVRKDGTVDSFRVVRGLGYGLDESAINTIATKWRFRPGTLNGVPVDVQANIEVTFRLY